MPTNADFKTVKEKKLDKETNLKISKNNMNGRIFVEFTSKNPNIVLQKNFQDTLDGRKQAEEFSKSITNKAQLINYFSPKDSGQTGYVKSDDSLVKSWRL